MKPAEARVKEEKGARLLGPAPTAATEGWSIRPWPFTPRAESTISFGGPVAEETSNLCYMFGMTNDKEPVKKVLLASSSAAIISQHSVNSNLVPIVVGSGASGHYFDDAITRDLKYRLQDYVYLTTPRKIFTVGGAMLDGAGEDVLQGLVTDDYGNLALVRVDIVVVPGIGRNLFSVMTAVKISIMTIFDLENPRLEGINVTVPLRSKSDDLYLFVLDLIAGRYSTKELAMNTVANAQVWHQRLGNLHA